MAKHSKNPKHNGKRSFDNIDSVQTDQNISADGKTSTPKQRRNEFSFEIQHDDEPTGTLDNQKVFGKNKKYQPYSRKFDDNRPVIGDNDGGTPQVENPPLPPAEPRVEDPPLPPAEPRVEDPAYPMPEPRIEDPAYPMPEPRVEDPPLPPAEPRIEDPAYPMPEPRIENPFLPPGQPQVEDPPLPPAPPNGRLTYDQQLDYQIAASARGIVEPSPFVTPMPAGEVPLPAYLQETVDHWEAQMTPSSNENRSSGDWGARMQYARSTLSSQFPDLDTSMPTFAPTTPQLSDINVPPTQDGGAAITKDDSSALPSGPVSVSDPNEPPLT